MKISENLTLQYFIGISLIGLFYLPAMVLFGTASANPPWQKYLIFSIFGLICLLGIIAGVFPSKCLKTTKKKTQNIMDIEFKGHHPDCGNFSGHVLHLANKTCCVGCTGLTIGAILSISGTLLYLTNKLPYNGTMVFWLGFVGVLFGLMKNRLFKKRLKFLDLFLNVIFVLGAFMLLLGIEKINGNLLIEVYLLILILTWIITRTLSSQKEHKRICELCNLKKCKPSSYPTKKTWSDKNGLLSKMR